MTDDEPSETTGDVEQRDESTIRATGRRLGRRELLRAAAASAAATGLAGCAGAGTGTSAGTGTGTGSSTSTPGGNSTPTPTPTPTSVLSASVPNCDSYETLAQKDVNGGVTLSAGCYRIENEHVVDSGTLTLEPGVLVEFGKDAGLQFKTGGALAANGSLKEPVFLLGKKSERGYWKGLGFLGDGTNANTMKNTVIAHGGGELWTGDWSTKAAVFVTGATVDVEGAVLRDNGHKALMARNHKGELTISETIFESNEKPVRIHADHIRAFAPSNTVKNNDVDRVLVVGRGTSDGVLTDGTWEDPGVPFWFRQNITLKADITIEPGTAFEFGKKKGLDVNGGTLTVNGSANDPVRFRGDKNERGRWAGIRFRNTSAANAIEHTLLRDAGGALWHGAQYSKAGIFVQGDATQVRLSNSTFAHNANSAVTATGKGYDFTVENCEFTDNAVPLRVSADLVKNLAVNNSFSGNDASYVLLGNSGSATAVTRPMTWGALGVPYRLSRDLTVKAALEIDPGTTIEAGKKTSIWVPFDAGGSLKADASGANEETIVFTGTKQEPGRWGGIHFASANASNALRNVVVEYAGGELRNGDWESKACVTAWEWKEVPVVALEQVTLRASGKHGIYKKCDANLSCGKLSFENISEVNIWDGANGAVSGCAPTC